VPSVNAIALIEEVCLRNDLASFDPYDIWKTNTGVRTKTFFNCNRYAGMLPAALLSVLDLYLNSRRRWLYRKQEYPIVRAFGALILLALYKDNCRRDYLAFAKTHLDWLVGNGCKGYKGLGWGLSFEWPVSCGLYYDSNTPLSTATPYALEALVRYSTITASDEFVPSILKIYEFFEKDIKVIRESKKFLITSYGPSADRIVTNAVSYAMFSYCLLLPYVSPSDKSYVESKIIRLYNFVVSQQRSDGSWLYSPQGNSFIDCFHSCIVLKNIIKSHKIFELPGADTVIAKGYEYLIENLRDKSSGLFRRFTKKNKPSLVRFDLYDNAEMLNLSYLMGDSAVTKSLQVAIRQEFHQGSDIYSQTDIFGIKQNKNMLRWAVMPYLYALTQCGETCT
jgi:hypothetical protein